MCFLIRCTNARAPRSLKHCPLSPLQSPSSVSWHRQSMFSPNHKPVEQLMTESVQNQNRPWPDQRSADWIDWMLRADFCQSFNSSPVRVCALCVLHGPDWGGSGVFSPLSICHNERLLMIWVTFSRFKCVCVCVCCILLTQLNTKGRLLMFWRVFLLVVLSLVFLLVFCSF